MLMDMLVLLVDHAGEVVSKDEIVGRVRDDRFVSESALSRDMASLRRLLGDDTRHPRYIETIPKRGFRLVARVDAIAPRGLPRVAVLPFQSFGRETGDDFLTDGYADALTTELARLPALFVISRQSMLRFRASSKTIPEIAREVNVDAVVEGSVLRTEGRVRVTAQLIDAGHLHMAVGDHGIPYIAHNRAKAFLPVYMPGKNIIGFFIDFTDLLRKAFFETTGNGLVIIVPYFPEIAYRIE